MNEIIVHETLRCKNSVCANELCGANLELIPSENLVKFKVPTEFSGEQEKIACSKKCKKVAKFGFILKNGSENEAMKAFEGMLKKKMNKKQETSIRRNKNGSIAS
jgi:hypothetical protein